MIGNYNHQKTIGIIGATPDSQAFVLEANKLGFETYLLSKSEEEASFIYGANKVFIGTLNERAIHEEFLMKSDILVYYDETLNASELVDIQKTVIVPQGDDLLSIAQDRVLQKAFLESLSVNIAPYVTVVKPEDIKQGMRSIGYPAVLRTNQINLESNEESFFIYDENDIERAASLLKYGTCVLESWVISEYELSISAVKTANGEVKLFPIVKREYRDNRLANIQVPVEIEDELQDEINRVTQVIFGKINFQGLATINFLVTPANALYAGTIYPYPNIFSRYSEYGCTLSTTEAHLRAVTSLPVMDNIVMNSDYIYVPFYTDQTEIIDEMLTIFPEWKFNFYPNTKKENIQTEEAVGHILIQATDQKKILMYLKDKGF